MSRFVNVFMGGDIYADVGLKALEKYFPILRQKEQIDFAIINAENEANGFGIIPEDADKIFSFGIDVITSGNHVFQKKEIYPYLDSHENILRPANYPEIPDDLKELLNSEEYENYTIPGHGFVIIEKDGIRYAVLNIQGREFMSPVDSPFIKAFKAWKEASLKDAMLFIDFHAESNEEKEALGLFLDGKAVAVCGTHTHVQTSDERILPLGTAYITDLGMTGVADSVIGTVPEVAIKRNLTQILYKMEIATEPEAVVQGVIIKVDAETGKAVSIKRV